MLEAEACSALRSHILELRESTGSLDNRYVPGTRLRFGDARDIEMAAIQRRTDVLLPLDDALVKRALCTAARMLPVEEAAACLPRDDDDGAELLGLELVECGALVAWSGAPHQPLHADFKRLPTADIAATDTPADGEKPALSGRLSRPAPADGETPALSGRLSRPTAASIDGATPPAPRRAPSGEMPPRVVVFLYLQDAPTAAQGATAFVRGTANSDAHLKHLHRDGTVKPSAREALCRAGTSLATLRAGDALMYDASVLHFGSANSVADNDRVVLYFGVSRGGAAAKCAGPPIPDREAVPAVRVDAYFA